MSDLEQQLSDVLADVAEEAPHGVGLADGARRRHRVRRQRRLALGAAAAAVVVVAGAVVVGELDGPDRASDPVDQQHLTPGPQEGWQTVAVGTVRADIPESWVEATCEDDDRSRWAPPGGDACSGARVLVFDGSLYDLASEPGALLEDEGGTFSGLVGVGHDVVSVARVDARLARQILASARRAEEQTLAATRWVAFDRGGLAYEIPAWWGLGEEADRAAYSVCLVSPDSPLLEEAVPESGRYVLSEQRGPEGVIRVAAPSQALGQLVMATVDSWEAVVSEECATEDFSTGLLPGESTPGAGQPVEGHERTLDLPTSDWEPGDPQLKARIAGVLQLAGDCVVLDGGPIIWPADYTATVDESGRVTLRDPGGAVVAHDGDRIDAGGGWSSAPEIPDPCLPPGEVPYVQSEVTVIP